MHNHNGTNTNSFSIVLLPQKGGIERESKCCFLSWVEEGEGRKRERHWTDRRSHIFPPPFSSVSLSRYINHRSSKRKGRKSCTQMKKGNKTKGKAHGQIGMPLMPGERVWRPFCFSGWEPQSLSRHRETKEVFLLTGHRRILKALSSPFTIWRRVKMCQASSLLSPKARKGGRKVGKHKQAN